VGRRSGGRRQEGEGPRARHLPGDESRRTMVTVAQSVRAPDCGSGGCGFDSRQSPSKCERGGSAAAAGRCEASGRAHAVAQVGSSTGRALVSKTSGWGFESLPACCSEGCWGDGIGSAGRPRRRCRNAAVSSRGPGHSPLKAGTRVRIPLPLCAGCRCLHVEGSGKRDGECHPSPRHDGPIVYRSGRHSFKVQRGVRFPLGLSGTGRAAVR
jgi:hypothetical protein